MYNAMENHNQEEFADRKLDLLQSPEDTVPDGARGRLLIHARMGVKPRRWALRLAPVGVALVLILAVPAAKAVARTGTFSGDTIYEVFMQLHVEMRQFHQALWELFH